MEKDRDTVLLLSEDSCLISTDKTKQRKRNSRSASKCRKVCVFTSCLVQVIMCSGIGYGLSVMYAELVVVFSAKRSVTALIQSLNMGLASASGIIFAGMIKKFGPGKSIMIGSVFSCLGLFVSSFARELTGIIIGTGVIAGMSMGICYLAAFITIGWVFSESASFFLICLTSGISIGQFIIPLLFETFISQYSWSGAFVLISGVSLQCIPCGLIIHYSKDFFKKGSDTPGKQANAYCDPTILKDVVMWVVLMNFLLISMTVNVEAWFIVDHMVSLGFTRESGSILVSVIGIGSLTGRVSGALLRFSCRYPVVYHWVYLCLIIAGLHVLIINLYNYWALVAACIVYGISFATSGSLIPAIMFEASGVERYPQGIALVNVMCGIGDTAGALFGGFIRDLLGSYTALFYIASGTSVYMSVSTLLAACLMNRRQLTEQGTYTSGTKRK